MAVKTLKENVIVSSDSLLAEAGIMKKCNHPNLVKLYGVCSREEPFLIITEFMENGALLQYMKSEDGRRVMDSLEIQLKTCEQVMRFMMHKGYTRENMLIYNQAHQNLHIFLCTSSVNIVTYICL